MTKAQHSPRRLLAHPATFTAFVFAWTWSFWFAAIALADGTSRPEGLLLALLGLLGPTVGGILFTLLTRDAAGRRDYWLRLIDIRRIPAPWLAVIVATVPLLMGATALIDLLTGGEAAAYAEAAADVMAQPGMIPVYLLMILLFGPLPEEFGWHGYLLDRLQERHSALISGMTLGVIWGAWHLPLFFMPGTYQHEQGPFTLWFWTFMIGIVPLEVVMAWIYNATRRSTLGIIIFHFMVVVTCNFLNATPGANVISTLLWIGLAAAISWRGLPRPRLQAA